ncbi:MAG: ArsC/Spx/MgsR family protein [Myxococcota bacterium]|nr:ArsC/Spx/MgsR family protein [Myxococcota bacterium]
MTIVLYHNPDCSKSRALKAALEERGVAFSVIQYLETPPSREELLELIGSLVDPPGVMIRKDRRFSELELDPLHYGEEASAERVANLLIDHPELMQRPILRGVTRAAIGRPLEKALAVL